MKIDVGLIIWGRTRFVMGRGRGGVTNQAIEIYFHSLFH